MNTIYNGTPDSRLYKEVLGKTIGELLETDEKVVYLDADLMSCIGTAKLPEKFDRAVNCGIAESNMIGIAGLSFLGLGVVPPKAEWGSMINEARAYVQLAPWSVLVPAAAVIVTVMVFNYLGDAVRDYSDVSEAK